MEEYLLRRHMDTIAALVRVEGMKAENQKCIQNNEPLKYSEYDFTCIAMEIENNARS